MRAWSRPPYATAWPNGITSSIGFTRFSAKQIIDLARKIISEAPLARIDYVDLADAETLQPIECVKPHSPLTVAVYFGKTRLIDNILLG